MDKLKLAAALRALNPVGNAEAMIVGTEHAGPAEDPRKWPQDPIGGQRYKEIDDSQAGFTRSMRNRMAEAVRQNDGVAVGQRTTIFPHDKLDARMQSPEQTPLYAMDARNMEATMGKPSMYGFYSPQEKAYGLNIAMPEADETMIHEMQHEIDDKQGVVELGNDQPYLQQPTEQRARVTEQRYKMSPIERERFPYPDHARLEVERSKNPDAELGYQTQEEVVALTSALRNAGVEDRGALSEMLNKVVNRPGHFVTKPGEMPDQPGKQRHWRSGAGGRTWLEQHRNRSTQ